MIEFLSVISSKGTNMLISKRFFVVSMLCLFSCIGLNALEGQSDQFPSHEQTEKEEQKELKSPLEESYEALDKDHYDKLRNDATDKEKAKEWLMMSAEKGSPANGKKALFILRLNEDKDKEKKAELEILQNKVDACREKSQKKAFISGALTATLSIAGCMVLVSFGSWLVGRLPA